MLLKLSQFAKQQGICYMTAYRWWHKGLLNGIQNGKLILIDSNNPLKTGEDKSKKIEADYLSIKDSLKFLEESNKNLNKLFNDSLSYLQVVTKNLK